MCNKANIQKMIDFIKVENANGIGFNMQNWVQIADEPQTVGSKPLCGTTACFGGTAIILKRFEESKQSKLDVASLFKFDEDGDLAIDPQSGQTGESIISEAAEWMGLNRDMARFLFVDDDNMSFFNDRPDRAIAVLELIRDGEIVTVFDLEDHMEKLWDQE